MSSRSRGKRTRFGLLRDHKTRKPVAARPKGGTCVYKVQPCRRCGVDILNDTCACAGRSKPLRPRPGRIFASYTNGEVA